ncbi:MAG: hypothetical protein E7352_04250 [Clostridiales bacterium]|nr:hypothetical protein [Clostridiales bacterium]
MTRDLTNRFLLIEWDKIKDADIFTSIEEFAELFYSIENGKCFRKYTAYPWSKKNFFFGSYSDFLNFQKTTMEIPFFLEAKINTKIFNLTLLSFFRDENRKLYANCKCDCGNEVVKSYDSILKRSARTCGCIKGQGEKKIISIYDAFPEMIEKYWDYEKNSVDPKQVPLNSIEEYWWKGYIGSFQMSIQSLKHNISGTSFPEQAICFFLETNNIQVIHRYKIQFENKNYELDLFLPEYNVAIEYDGVFWHKKKRKIENQKNLIVENLNISLIRIREKGLSKTGITNGIEICLKKTLTDTSLSEVINKIFAYLKTLSGKEFSWVSAEDVSRNKLLIQKRYTLYYQEDNIANSWMSVYWSKNNTIEPYLIPTNSSQKFYFECKHGAKFYYSPNFLSFKRREHRIGESEGCFFKNTYLCRRSTQIAKGIDLKIIDCSFTKTKCVQIDFSIENQTPTSFYALKSEKNLMLFNGEYYYANRNEKCYIIPQETTSIPKLVFFPCEPLEIMEGRPPFDLEAFSQKKYSVSCTLKENQPFENADIILLLEMKDTCNWIYKICIYIHKDGLNISHNAQILPNRMLDNIIANNYLLDSNKRIPNKKGMYNIIEYLKNL